MCDTEGSISEILIDSRGVNPSIELREIKSNRQLGAFYTKAVVSKLLIDSMENCEPKFIIDLGSGEGALSRAAAERWSTADLTTVDYNDAVSIDARIWSEGNVHRHLHADALTDDIFNHLNLPQIEGFDAVLSNPPYTNPRWREGFAKIFEESGLSTAVGIRSCVSADIIFLAQAIRLLRQGGHAGLIVPDNIITGAKNEALRAALLEQHSLHRVISLPRGSFVGTDARAHILLFQKGSRNRKHKVELSRLSDNGNLSQPIFVSHNEAVKRMDYEYQRMQSLCDKPNQPITSSSYSDLHILRGSLSAAECREIGVGGFHTTDFNRSPREVWGIDNKTLEVQLDRLKRLGRNRVVVARPNDVVVGRVGRNITKQVALLRAGHLIVSECVFVLRTSESSGAKLFKDLSSDAGAEWLDAQSQGVAARFLTKRSMSTIPNFASDI